MKLLALALGAFATLAPLAAGAAVLPQSFVSEAGDAIVTLGGAPVTLSAVAITKPHPAWVGNGAAGTGAVWISYDPKTGAAPATVPPNSKKAPYMTVRETFFVPKGGRGTIDHLTVYGDDTVELILNGVTLFAPNFSQDICAKGKIGCEKGEEGTFAALVLQEGENRLDFAVWQVGGSAFGLQYAGAATITPVPAALPLLASALGLGAVLARRRTASSAA